MLDWRRLFPERRFMHPMAVRPGDAGRYFRDEDRGGAIMRERRRWIAESPELYVAIEPDAWECCFEATAAIAAWRGLLIRMIPPRNYDEALRHCVWLSGKFEPDWVVLRTDEAGVHRMAGGGVCFPSSWAMREKMGKPIHEIHVVVPGLNEALGRRIQEFLSNLKRGETWERENWGMSADAELNHHPSRALKKLGSDARLEATWLRVERQLLHRLQFSGAILFGIRVNHFLLSKIIKEAGAAERIANALETMPEDVASYKGIGAARAGLIGQLKASRLS